MICLVKIEQIIISLPVTLISGILFFLVKEFTQTSYIFISNFLAQPPYYILKNNQNLLAIFSICIYMLKSQRL